MKSAAFVFPGQGSQAVEMLVDIAKTYSEITAVYDEASDVLGYDLWQLVKSGPKEKLDQTTITQPALLAGSYAIWCILQNHTQIIPEMLAGHSLGEYTALVCAEALSFKDAIRLVAARGQFMQEAVPADQGAMAAIVGLEDEAVQLLCHEAALPNEVLTPANFNSPGQVVIAGHKASVEKAITLAKAKGAKLAKLLSVSTPSHCSLMKPAAERLNVLLRSMTIKTPVIPVLNNADVSFYQNPEAICDGLVRQLYMPVRWVEIMQMFARKEIQHVVECGPGKVLTGLNKRIAPEIKLYSTGDLTNLMSILN